MISQLEKYRKQIESLQKELAEIRERYYLFTQMCPDAVVTVCDGRFSSINKAGLKLYGVKNEKEILGKKALNFLHSDYHVFAEQRIKQLMQGKPVPLFEQKLILGNGKVVDIESVATPFMLNGKVVIEAIVRDITERKKSHKTLEEKNIALRELLNLIGHKKNSIVMEKLSPKEASICNMIRQNIPNKEIARLLKISPLTVGTQRNRIRKKLGLGSKINLTVYLQNN